VQVKPQWNLGNAMVALAVLRSAAYVGQVLAGIGGLTRVTE
jgi:hypothetical protein